ncbi:MAG: DUF4255 domain-containing protein [Ruminococcaceae bacterium]|nr:DUF4255 domain-containing protein [Oscillospiraceae bacterium]
MAGYGIISDVSEAIIRILREGMVPDIIQGSEGIGMCHPSDKGDISLGIYLYDIKRNIDIIPTDKVPVGAGKLRNPPLFVDLYYMITAYSMSDIKFRTLEEAKILGRAMQLLQSRSTLKGDILGKSAAELTHIPRIELLDLESEEKTRIWNIPDTPYKLSLFYKVYPIEIDSLTVSDVTRVTTADFTIEEKTQ